MAVYSCTTVGMKDNGLRTLNSRGYSKPVLDFGQLIISGSGIAIFEQDEEVHRSEYVERGSFLSSIFNPTHQ
jgi:hypothetical protein